MSALQTQDGTWLIVDPQVGSASDRTREEALREIERRKAAEKARAA